MRVNVRDPAAAAVGDSPAVSSVNTYRIEKIRLPVTVVLRSGSTLAGDIFLNPTSRFRSEQQEPGEFLNEGDDFFALADPEGSAALVAKTTVESLTTDHRPPPSRGVPPHPVPVRILLRSGATVTGTVSVDAPPSRARLLDYLNSLHDRFICVTLPDQLVLVNRQAISHVHELT